MNRRARVSALWCLPVLLASATAQAGPLPLPWPSANLQNCTQGVYAELPIGSFGDPGYSWKLTIVDWLSALQTQDFAWTEPLEVVDPLQAYGVGYAPNGNLCNFAPPQVQNPPPGQVLALGQWGIGPAEHLHIEQLWLLGSTSPDFFMPWQWFNHDPAIFTLDEMIDEATCEVKTPGIAWGDSLAFLASWDYAGSPFHPATANNRALKLRLAAWLGLQLVMLDDAHNGNSGTYGAAAFPPHSPPQRFAHPLPATNPAAPWADMRIGAELSGQLALLAWTFRHVRGILDPGVDAAMREALLTYAERVALWNPYYPQTNRGIRAAYALRYVFEETGDLDTEQHYQAVLKQFFDPGAGNWIKGGYWRDDYGLDLGYGGSNLMAAVRVLAEDATAPTFARDAIELSHELAAHLAVRDVDGRWTAPQAFNSRTPNGTIRNVSLHVRNGYYGGLPRFLLGYAEGMPYAAASLRDVDVLAPQGPNFQLDPRVAGFHENLACLSTGYVGYMNLALDDLPETIDPYVDSRGQCPWPNLTRSQDWAPPPTFIEEHRLGTLVDLWDELAVPGQELMPVEEPGTKIRNFGDRFVYGRFDGAGPGTEYAAVLHVGEVGQLAGGDEAGLGGGQLASLWTLDGGPTLLARRKGRGQDDWSQWETFPVHAITLQTASGRVSSTTLNAIPTAQVFPLAQAPTPGQIADALAGSGAWAAPAAVPDSQASAALVWVKGEIPAQGYGTTGGYGPSLLQPIRYRRAFLMMDGGIWIRSTLGGSAAGELLTDAWETVPIWNRDRGSQTSLLDTRILLHSTLYGQPVDASMGSGGTVSGVTMIEVLRGAGVTRIHLDKKRDVEVSAAWTLGQQESHTLLIKRLPQGCNPLGCALPASETLEYFIEEAP